MGRDRGSFNQSLGEPRGRWVDCTFKMIVATATADGQLTSEKLALLIFKEICCRSKLPLNLTMDNDVNFVSSLWQYLWQLYGIMLW